MSRFIPSFAAIALALCITLFAFAADPTPTPDKARLKQGVSDVLQAWRTFTVPKESLVITDEPALKVLNQAAKDREGLKLFLESIKSETSGNCRTIIAETTYFKPRADVNAPLPTPIVFTDILKVCIKDGQAHLTSIELKTTTAEFKARYAQSVEKYKAKLAQAQTTRDQARARIGMFIDSQIYMDHDLFFSIAQWFHDLPKTEIDPKTCDMAVTLLDRQEQNFGLDEKQKALKEDFIKRKELLEKENAAKSSAQ